MSVQPLGIATTEKQPLPVAHLRAVEFIRRMPGGSQPSLLRCEDGGTYVVKFQNNPQHVRVLANEMLAGRLARLIALPAAEPAFVEVPLALVETACQPGMRAERRPLNFTAGLHYGSRFPGDPAETRVVDFLPARLLRRVTNLAAAFLGALLFDQWTCNCDGRQLVFYRPAGHGESKYPGRGLNPPSSASGSGGFGASCESGVGHSVI